MKNKIIAKSMIITLLTIKVLGPQIAHAQNFKKFTQSFNTTELSDREDPYFQIKTMSIEEIESLEFNSEADKNSVAIKSLAPQLLPVLPQVPSLSIVTPNGPLEESNRSGIIMIIDELIAIGQKILPSIKEGRPVLINNPMASISVLPRSENKDPVVHDMGGWSIPVSKHYKISYTNGFGMEVVSFIYSISYQHSGTYNGKGKYLAGIRAAAKNITISWGFDVEASSQLIQIANVGTQDNVIAGATIEMNYTVKNWSTNITNSRDFFISGDGRLYKLD